MTPPPLRPSLDLRTQPVGFSSSAGPEPSGIGSWTTSQRWPELSILGPPLLPRPTERSPQPILPSWPQTLATERRALPREMMGQQEPGTSTPGWCGKCSTPLVQTHLVELLILQEWPLRPQRSVLPFFWKPVALYILFLPLWKRREHRRIFSLKTITQRDGATAKGGHPPILSGSCSAAPGWGCQAGTEDSVAWIQEKM